VQYSGDDSIGIEDSPFCWIDVVLPDARRVQGEANYQAAALNQNASLIASRMATEVAHDSLHSIRVSLQARRPATTLAPRPWWTC